VSLLSFRDFQEGDVRFIRHSWVESFRVSHYAGMVPMEDYHRVYHRLIQKLMDRDGVDVLVCFNPQHESQIYGFVCFEKGFTLPVIHYVYVKEDFRRLPGKDGSFRHGIATMLLNRVEANPKSPFYYTFKTGAWATLVKQNGPFSGGIYRPLFARFPKEDAVNHERDMLAIRERRRKSKPSPKVEHKRCTSKRPGSQPA
jgi:hypothetical protein